MKIPIPSGFSKEQWAERLFVPLYKERYTETLWNTRNPDRKAKGWELKSGLKAPWFFNMRPVGCTPALFNNICQSMAEMIALFDVDVLIGVEMAGIPLVGGISVYLNMMGDERRIGYTRPLPGGKIRKPEDAVKALEEVDAHPEVADYSEKSFVEARLAEGDRVAIVDDMATDIGSKIIARQIVLWQNKHDASGIRSCNFAFYFLNRTKGNMQKGLDHLAQPDARLFPAQLYIRYIMEFDDYLPLLKDVMAPEEYETIHNFQFAPSFKAAFQNEKEREKIIKLAQRGL